MRGALKFEDSVAGATNVVILTANVDAGSAASAALARGTVLDRRASVFLVHGGESISRTRVGWWTPAPRARSSWPQEESVAESGSSVSSAVNNTYVVPFSGERVESATSISVAVDGYVIEGSYSFGAVTDGKALAPIAVPEPTTLPWLDFLEGETAKRAGIVLAAVAAFLGAFALAMLFQRDESGLNEVLEAYADPYAPAGGLDTGNGSFAKSLFVKRAVEITEGIAERQGALERVEQTLARADLPLRAGEAFTAYAGIVVGAVAFGILFVGGLVGLILMSLIGLVVPPAVVNVLATRRTKAFLGHFDMLRLPSSTLKAGYSFMQGIEAVSHEVEEPMGGELRRIVTEAQQTLVDKPWMHAQCGWTHRTSPGVSWRSGSSVRSVAISPSCSQWRRP